MARFNSDVTAYGANWLYSISGVQRSLGQIQAGQLYLETINETKATGFFNPNWEGDGRLGDSVVTGAPHVQITPSVDPSGRYYISASGTESFTVTFLTTPIGDNFADVPYKVADWLAVL